MSVSLTELEFDRLARAGYNRIPVVQKELADLTTPLAVYLRLADAPYSYLLESVVGGEHFGRHSVIGLPARTVLTMRGEQVEVRTDGQCVETHTGDPLDFLRAYQARFRVPTLPGLPRFSGGLVGYFAYDAVQRIGPKPASGAVIRPQKYAVPNPALPDMQFLLSEELVVFDSLNGQFYLVVYADPAQPQAYVRAHARLHALCLALREPVGLSRTKPCPMTAPRQDFSEADFKAAVARVKQYIVDGDVMRVQIAQRMSLRFEQAPILLYRALRALNPSPYLFHLNLGENCLIGTSPEILVRREEDKITVRPLAGTRPRGKTREEDLALERELLTDPKETAEHAMLIDLGRNDIGRIARTGTVQVTADRVIERYSHVMHIVSHVEGKLKEGLDNIDVLRAIFPAGTLTGMPKVRVMEIIDALEPIAHGAYGGALGCLGFNQNMDLTIIIRTAVIHQKMLYVQAAAGIVADSDPEREWQETRHKMRGVLRAVELAQGGFQA